MPTTPRPLDGITVVDLSRVLAGPFCTMLLGDMGARVIKIEEPTAGDETRDWWPSIEGWSTYFLGMNRNKQSVALNLKDARDAETLRALVAKADVLVENFRPGALTALGFGYDAMAALNPRLVYCSISGYGQTGARAGLPGYDPVIQGEAGLMEMTGQRDGPPTRVAVAITDYLASLFSAQGILLALVERQRSGLGQHVDVALFDSLMAIMALPAGIHYATGQAPQRMGNDHPSIAPFETLPTGDGHIVITAGNPRQWVRCCEALGIPGVADDPRFRTNADRLANRPAMQAALGEALGRLSTDEAVAALQAAGVPCGRVREIGDALTDPQLEAREMLLTLAREGLDGFRAIGNPIKLSRTPAATTLPPPALGEHTAAVLDEVAGDTD
jgi:formyl-CoA transferase